METSNKPVRRNIFHHIVENKYFKIFYFLTVIMSTIVLAIQSPSSVRHYLTFLNITSSY